MKVIINKLSIVFNMIKILGVKYRFLESSFILCMAKPGFYSRIIDIVEGVFS